MIHTNITMVSDEIDRVEVFEDYEGHLQLQLWTKGGSHMLYLTPAQRTAIVTALANESTWTRQCKRCRKSSRQVGELLGGICGNCGDDLRGEQQAYEADPDREREAVS